MVETRPKVIPEEQWEEWKKKRKTTTIGCLIVAFADGMDRSFFFSPLYMYLATMVHVSNPELFYGIIIASFNLSSTISGLYISRYFDKTKKLRLFTTLLFVLQIVGCLVYVIPFNVWFLIIGRVLVGIGDPVRTVAGGEIAKIYINDQQNKVLQWFVSLFTTGFVMSPGAVMIFTGVDFHIGSIPITQLNAISLFVAAVILISLIALQYKSCSS